MASPWKFLVRMISPRREQRRENGSIEKISQSGPSAIAGPTEAPAEESFISADRPANDEALPRDQAAAIFTGRVRSEEVKNVGRVDAEDAEVVQAADPALFDETGTDVFPAHRAVDIQGAVEGAPRKQRSRREKAVADPNVSQVTQVSDTANEMSLDGEIKLLRGQLAKKLKLQNAQLRKMLERFER